jgi:N-dimethylarginine dimethylaminohydrolase
MRFLMCPPDYFGVEYVINPWMRGNEGHTHSDAARRQWQNLYDLLTTTLGASVELVCPRPGLPDMVFTANAGQLYGNRVVPARFRPVERRGEEPHFRTWFVENGFEIREIPPGLHYEGAGDALFHYTALDVPPLLWAAYGFRSDRAVHATLADLFGAEVISLHLTDPRYYHLDTCFCPLPGGNALWHPSAFDAESRAAIETRIPEEMRYAVSDADAADFACNAVAVGDASVVLNAASAELRDWLGSRGFTTYITPLTEFLKAGGSAKCLTLRLEG